MGLTLVTPPTADPVTLAEAKIQCGVRGNDADHEALLTRLITAATRYVERSLSLSLMERTYRLDLDVFSDAIELCRGPVTSVTSVQYVDEDGVTQTIDAENYTVDLSGRAQWVVRNSDYDWPSTLNAVNVVSVTYVAGFDELPAEYEDLKHAILLLVGHWFNQRETVTIGATNEAVEFAVDALMQNFRWVLV